MFKNPFRRADQSTTRKKRIVRVILFVVVLFLIAFGALAWKTGFILNKITLGNANIFSSLVKSLPGVSDQLQGEEEGRINILLLGMRGEGVEGGGTLADTIMVLSVHPKTDDADTSRASLISIPRDLYVTVPGTDQKSKINYVYAHGEERDHGGGGIEDMRQVVSEVSGLSIPYAVTINFKGFTDLVNALGGIDITLDAPFQETEQFDQLHVCDNGVFTEPAKNASGGQLYECKYSQRPRSSTVGMYVNLNATYPLCQNKPASNLGIYRIAAQYPLCHNANPECGGDFSLSAGQNHLDGDKALCYARSRYQSNDFERAARQQRVIQAIKEKALSLGTLTDFSKVNDVLDSLGNNVSTNLQAWELRRFYELQQKLGDDVKPKQSVLSDSEEGLLSVPQDAPPEAGYILLPRGGNYDRVHALFQNSLNP
ncbi:MAG: LCP family protein [Candidatus Moraniibacteriota bacterium]